MIFFHTTSGCVSSGVFHRYIEICRSPLGLTANWFCVCPHRTSNPAVLDRSKLWRLLSSLLGAIKSRRSFDVTREVAILKTILAARSAAAHLDRRKGSWAFIRYLICHLMIRSAAALEGVWRPFRGQVSCDLMSQRHQKRSVLQPLVAIPSAGLEPQRPHHLRGTWFPLDWCLGFKHRPRVSDARMRTTIRMRLRVC